MSAFFRVDAGNKIGLGHLIRCLSVAEILRKEGVISFFFVLEGEPSALQLIKRENHEMISLVDNYDFFKYLNYDQLVILDGYKFDSTYEYEIKKRVRRLVTIDDLHDRHFYADVVINHTPGINADLYDKETYTRIFSGLNYGLLRNAFFRSERKNEAPIKLQRSLVCLGGSDPENQTEFILQFLKKELPDICIDVVIGSSYMHIETLNTVAKGLTLVKIHCDVDATYLISLIQKADFAVVSASTISLECLYLRIPLYLVKVAENQSANFSYLVNNGLAISYLDVSQYTFEIGNAMLTKQKEYFVGDIQHNIKEAILN
jgi:UDP-2,4-diacetamido-2,4,6-trideoxy-beta-L-altropyranose hydrolase